MNPNVQLGYQYLYGQGVKRNEKKAVRLFQLATSEGDADGEAWLAFCYFQGKGIEKNEKEALRLSELGVEKGHPFAYGNLGFYYCYCASPDQKITNKGVELVRKGAQLGNSYAISLLATCYFYGTGVKKDFKEAARLSGLAAEKKNPNPTASYNLGKCYQLGWGVEHNPNET